jgi:hypothetical protein
MRIEIGGSNARIKREAAEIIGLRTKPFPRFHERHQPLAYLLARLILLYRGDEKFT